MKKYISEFKYDLRASFVCHDKGEAFDASYLIIKAPSNKQRNYVHPIKQILTRASFELASKKDGILDAASNANKVEPNDEEEDQASQLMTLIYASEQDVNKFVDLFRDLMTSGCILVDGKVEINKVLFDKMSLEDSNLIIGEYFDNFLQ